MNRLMAGFLADVSKGQHNPKTPAAALEDTQAAVKLVRERAAEWKIDPKRVGVIGFSAGALMAVSDAVAPDRAGRADFIGSLYGQLVPQPVPSDASPMFAAMASDDPLSGQGGFELITAWQKANRPVELHLYAKGGHGFSLRHQGTTSDLWPEQFHAWMKAQGFLGAPGK
jgi:dienelactone hydrolase